MANDSKTWAMIHAEREALAELFETFTPPQWATASLCGGWTVHVAAAHILAGAEQTTSGFLTGLAANGFRFNTTMDRAARKLGELTPPQIIERLHARTSTTNRPPAPVTTMLGEIVVHGADITQPLGVPHQPAANALIACLEMYRKASFPVGGRKRIRGLRLRANDVAWVCGDGPEISGPALSLLLVMTGRKAGVGTLSGDGVEILTSRLSSTIVKGRS